MRLKGQGGVARLLCAVRGPAFRDREYPVMRLLAAMLGAGRASRLNRSLVEEARFCAVVSVEMTETLGAGALLVAAEVIPGVHHETVEQLLMEELDRITLDHGGRFYLAKDSRMSAKTLHRSDPRAADYAAYRDSEGLRAPFQSRQSERLSL